MGEGLTTVSGSALAAVIEDPSTPVLVEFFTPDCIPCRKLQPIIHAVAHEWPGPLRVFRADASDGGNAEWVAQYQVRSVPTLLLWRDGTMVDRQTGFVAPSALRQWLRGHLGESPS